MTALALVIAFLPAAVAAAIIIWMIVAGKTKTDAMPPDETPNPYPERFDTIGRVLVGGFTLVLFGITFGIGGIPGATVAFSVLIGVAAIGAVIQTIGQNVAADWRRRRNSPSAEESQLLLPWQVRLFRNFRDFYANFVTYIASYG